MTTTLVDMVIATTVTVLANGLGGLPFVFVKNFPETVSRIGWAVAGGLMISASVFNLIIPGVTDGGITPVAIGILAGAGLMAFASHRLESREDLSIEGLTGDGARRVMLVLLTLFIHSFPEGIAVGVAFGSGEVGLGLLVAVAIAIHNIPEGVAVSLPLRAAGVSGWRCVWWAIVSGIPQLLAAVPAYLAVIAFRPLLPYAFGFAAGAMLFLVNSEMIPESLNLEVENQGRVAAGVASIGGFLAMMILQNLLIF